MLGYAMATPDFAASGIYIQALLVLNNDHMAFREGDLTPLKERLDVLLEEFRYKGDPATKVPERALSDMICTAERRGKRIELRLGFFLVLKFWTRSLTPHSSGDSPKVTPTVTDANVCESRENGLWIRWLVLGSLHLGLQ